MIRPWIELPNGQAAKGSYPGMPKRQWLEHELSDVLAVQLRGVRELVLPYGRADVATASQIFEVESYTKWRFGMRQVLAYAAQTGLTPCLALFGPAHSKDVLRLYLKLRDGHPPVELWWHRYDKWQHISRRLDCRTIT
jgi:hypothetical protein